tara:strand:- start:1084 stop:1200 length:117 start_codon:yes stop_codon:yes gene_type:complete
MGHQSLPMEAILYPLLYAFIDWFSDFSVHNVSGKSDIP